MNKLIKTIVIVVLVIITAYFTWQMYMSVFYKGDLQTYNQTEFVLDNGLKYTVVDSQWKPMTVTETPVTSDIPYESKQVSLSLTDDKYVLVNVPANKEYFWDLGRAVYAEDGSYCIYVLSNCTMSNFSTLAGISKSENINSTTIVNKVTSKKQSRTIATLIGDSGYGLVCEVYGGNDVYTCLLDSLSVDKFNLIQIDSNITFSELSELPAYSGVFTHQINIGELSVQAERYWFENGYLYKAASYNSIEEIKTKYLTLLRFMSGSNSIKRFERENIYYYETNDCYLGLRILNSNTIVITLGCGEEAKCNVLYSLAYE